MKTEGSEVNYTADGQEEGATEVILCTIESKDLEPTSSTEAGWVIGP